MYFCPIRFQRLDERFLMQKSIQKLSVVLTLIPCRYRVYGGRERVRIEGGYSCKGWSHNVNYLNVTI